MKQFKYLFLFFYFVAHSQTKEFLWPLAKPISLNGNYGELRPNHFHAGLDFSTNKKINLPVYVTFDGYVSRIKVSAYGYGKAIYVTHPNGLVTVYAHLTNYVGKVSSYVKKEQLKRESYEIEIYPKSNELKFTAGDLIGYSGNTGSSTGPHLHYEIRDEVTEVPYNPANYYDIEDSSYPFIERVGIYNLADTSAPFFIDQYAVVSQGKQLKLKKDSITINRSIVGLSFSGFDRFVENGSKNNIHSARVYKDGKLIYHHELNNISFSDSRYVNEFSEVHGKYKFQKCFIPTLYPKGLYKSAFNKGRILLTDTNFHLIEMVFSDEHKNENKLSFYLRTNKFNYYKKPSINGDTYANCTKDLMYHKKKIQIYIPANTLYYSTPLIFENTLETTGKLIVLPSEANLNSTAIIGFEIPLKYRANKHQLVFKNVSHVYLPIIKNDSVFYSVRNFGWFNLTIDSKIPTIKPVTPLKKSQSIKKMKQLTFIIQDDLSGIATYKLSINDKWVLAEFDGKSGRLTYVIDSETPTGVINLKLEVTDKCLNKNSYAISLSN